MRKKTKKSPKKKKETYLTIQIWALSNSIKELRIDKLKMIGIIRRWTFLEIIIWSIKIDLDIRC
jgi:hypothetical protein